MRTHGRKMIAPIVVSIITAIYYAVYFIFLIQMLEGVMKYVLGFVPLIFVALIIVVCIDRIKEIKKGEEDDLSKY